MSFKIYKVNQWANKIEIIEIEAVRETEHFYMVQNPNRWGKSKEDRYAKASDYSRYFKSPKEAIDDHLANQKKTVDRLKERLANEEGRLYQINKFIAEHEELT